MRKGPGVLLAIALLGAAGLGGYLLLQRNAEPPRRRRYSPRPCRSHQNPPLRRPP